MITDRYILSLFPHLHTPFPPFSPSLISLVVSVDVKHHVCLTEAAWTVVLSRWFQSAAVLIKTKQVPQLVSTAAWYYIGPIIVLCVVTNGVGCDVARLLLGLNKSTRFLLQQKFVRRQCQYQPHSYPIEEGQVEWLAVLFQGLYL